MPELVNLTNIGVVDVPTLLASVGGTYYSERRDQLVDILDIDLSWRMHAVSDGERRRVQLAMGLIRPAQVLLLDELTADLDLLSRSSLLNFLKKESETKGTTIVYATHIMDNLSHWPTHLVHMHLGTVKEWGPATEYYNAGAIKTSNSELGELVLQWLKDDIKQRGPRRGAGEGKTYESHEGKGGYGNEKRK
jgi:CCR4-NOT complex subunit CAF16